MTRERAKEKATAIMFGVVPKFHAWIEIRDRIADALQAAVAEEMEGCCAAARGEVCDECTIYLGAEEIPLNRHKGCAAAIRIAAAIRGRS